MNKRILWLGLSFLLVAALVLTSCSPAEEGQQEEEEEEEESTPSGGGGLTWSDIPIYSGAKQVQKGTWAIPAEQGEWSKVEWRYYESDDSADDVASFYKSQMPSEGWHETMWMEAEGVAWAYYSKNGEEDGAMFWVASDEGETFFALMRSTK